MLTRKDYRRRQILKGRTIIALHELLGRKPTAKEIEWYSRVAHIMFTVMMPYLEKRTD